MNSLQISPNPSLMSACKGGIHRPFLMQIHVNFANNFEPTYTSMLPFTEMKLQYSYLDLNGSILEPQNYVHIGVFVHGQNSFHRSPNKHIYNIHTSIHTHIYKASSLVDCTRSKMSEKWTLIKPLQANLQVPKITSIFRTLYTTKTVLCIHVYTQIHTHIKL